MDGPKIPVFLAVGLWAASALAVLSYTLIAYKETSTGESQLAAAIVAPGSDLVAQGAMLAAEDAIGTPKPLNRGKFRPSR